MLSPTDPNTDTQAIGNVPALQLREDNVDFRETFLKRLKTPGTIKPISSSAMRLMEACRNPSGKITELVELIEADPAIATRTLALANSPVYGQTRMISSIKQAVVVLGMTSISQLATSFALTDSFLDSREINPDIKQQRQSLFNHSLATASVARNLAAITGTADEGTAYLAGALHDLGKQIFWELIPEEYQAIHQWTDRYSIHEIEKQVFGLTHDEVGEFCAQNWGLPQEIVSAIANHHRASDCTDEPIVSITESANYFARQWNVGNTSQVPKDANPENDASTCFVEQPDCTIHLDEMQQETCHERSIKEYEMMLQACGLASQRS